VVVGAAGLISRLSPVSSGPRVLTYNRVCSGSRPLDHGEIHRNFLWPQKELTHFTYKESILSVRKFCRLTIEIEYVGYGYLAFSHCFKTLRIALEGTFASHGALEKLFQVMEGACHFSNSSKAVFLLSDQLSATWLNQKKSRHSKTTRLKKLPVIR
jgi:hypothetical protein